MQYGRRPWMWAALPDGAVPPVPGPGAPVPGAPAPVIPVQPAPASLTFTQEQLNAIAAREKHQGQQAATREALGKLGVGTLDEALALVQSARQALQAQLTPEQAAAAATATAQAASAESLAKAQGEALQARVALALVAHGAPATAADGTPNTTGLAAVARMVAVGTDADDTAITTAVTGLKTAFPALFTGASVVSPPPPSSDPGRGPGAPAPGSTAPATGGRAWGQAGADQLARRYPQKPTG